MKDGAAESTRLLSLPPATPADAKLQAVPLEAASARELGNLLCPLHSRRRDPAADRRERQTRLGQNGAHGHSGVVYGPAKSLLVPAFRPYATRCNGKDRLEESAR